MTIEDSQDTKEPGEQEKRRVYSLVQPPASLQDAQHALYELKATIRDIDRQIHQRLSNLERYEKGSEEWRAFRRWKASALFARNACSKQKEFLTEWMIAERERQQQLRGETRSDEGLLFGARAVIIRILQQGFKLEPRELRVLHQIEIRLGLRDTSEESSAT